MTYQEVLSFSTATIHCVFADANIPFVNIYLFGSRSRNDYLPDSDWDFMVACKDELMFPQKAALIAKVQTLLAEKLISADVVIKSVKTIEKERNNVGVITYYAMKDGIEITIPRQWYANLSNRRGFRQHAER